MFLGIDAGGSATRWVVVDAGGAIAARGEVAPMSGHLFSDDARAVMRGAVAALAGAVGGAPAGVVAGITGLSATAPAAGEAAGMIAAAFEISADAVSIDDDIRIAFHALFRPGEGHLVYTGTGSIGLHIRADGTAIRVGGRGMLIDDGGSAFAIGRAALDHVWQCRDIDPDYSSPLADALDAAIGGRDWDTVRTYVYGGGRNAVAQLAPAVASADGEVVRRIMRMQGGDLARLAEALVAREGLLPVALVGRVARLHPEFFAAFLDRAQGIDVRMADIDAAAAAARLAAGVDAVQAHHPA